MRTLVWFRADLRVIDHPALHQACAASTRGVIGVFLICPDQWRAHDWAGTRVEFILRNLQALSEELEALNIPLLVRTTPSFDDAPETLVDLALRHGCDALYYNVEHELNERRRDREVADQFTRQGLAVQGFTDQTILPPGSVRTGSGTFYSVYTPFRKSWGARLEESGVPVPLGRPKRQAEMPCNPDDLPTEVDEFECDADIADVWPAGERFAAKRLKAFASKRLEHYARDRDRPDLDGTSSLSPYLAVGAVSIRQCLHLAWQANSESLKRDKSGPAIWIDELAWREFYRHVMAGWPRICKGRAFKEDTESIRWRDDPEGLAAWKEGRTGVPIVDAAMRQLVVTGWMHNRLRMIVAMFLTKDLLIDWREGERHFMRHLIDGDFASNNGGWQWAASTGVDAAPYFRIFNPFTQSRKCDPEGVFIRRWVPELADLDDKAIHEPHDADLPAADLDYPAPIVEHASARERAIEAFKGS